MSVSRSCKLHLQRLNCPALYQGPPAPHSFVSLVCWTEPYNAVQAQKGNPKAYTWSPRAFIVPCNYCKRAMNDTRWRNGCSLSTSFWVSATASPGLVSHPSGLKGTAISWRWSLWLKSRPSSSHSRLCTRLSSKQITLLRSAVIEKGQVLEVTSGLKTSCRDESGIGQHRVKSRL